MPLVAGNGSGWAEVGLPEGLGGLETVSEQAIDADVVEPDERPGHKGFVMGGESEASEGGRSEVGVDGVVAACTPAWACVIAEHR